MSDDTLSDTAAASAAAEPSTEPEASSVKKSTPILPAALFTAELFDMLQGYSGTLGES